MKALEGALPSPLGMNGKKSPAGGACAVGSKNTPQIYFKHYKNALVKLKRLYFLG
jgi:hypothetical protein